MLLLMFLSMILTEHYLHLCFYIILFISITNTGTQISMCKLGIPQRLTSTKQCTCVKCLAQGQCTEHRDSKSDYLPMDTRIPTYIVSLPQYTYFKFNQLFDSLNYICNQQRRCIQFDQHTDNNSMDTHNNILNNNYR